MDEKDQVLQLAQRLRNLRNQFVPLRSQQSQLRPTNIPPKLKLEIIQLYDTYGGINLLTSLTHVGYHTIKQWHREYKANPELFRQPIEPKIVIQKPKPETGKKQDGRGRPRKAQTYKGMSTFEELRSLFPVHLVNEIEKVRSMMQIREKRSIPIDDNIRKQVAALVIKSDQAIDQTPISIMLGLSERTVHMWKEQFAAAVSEDLESKSRRRAKW